MAKQHMHGAPRGADEPDEALEVGQAHINAAGTDELLDEIDALLDTNAEEFVRSFVQKGGQ